MDISSSLVFLVIIAVLLLLAFKVTKFIVRVIVLVVVLALVFSVLNFDLIGLRDSVDEIKDKGIEKGGILFEADCLTKGGTWIEETKKCDYVYDDAGLVCYDSSQCEGECIAEFVNDTYVGKCQGRSILSENYLLMEDGLVQEVNESEELS